MASAEGVRTRSATPAPAVVRSGGWAWLARPLFTAWLLGCVVSLLISGSLTLGRVVPATVTWSWVPLLEILALAAVWKLAPRPLPFTRAVDGFCAGNAPWWLLLVLFGAFHRLLPESGWLSLAAAVAAWTARLDYRFFHQSLRSPAPLRDLLLVRAISWVPGILLFGGASLWPGIVERLK